MMKKVNILGFLLLTANVLLCCVLGFSRTSAAAPGQPFGNAVQQRQDIVRELREIKALLKEQNALLRGPQE